MAIVVAEKIIEMVFIMHPFFLYVLTILHTTAGGCARTEAEMCIIVKTTSF